MDHRLSAASASWENGDAAGGWIGPLLDEFGPTLGHAVPRDYEAYAVVPLFVGEEGADRRDYRVLAEIIDLLSPFTPEQVVHTALWEGWGWLSDPGDDARSVAASIVFHAGPNDVDALRRAREEVARSRVVRPEVARLLLPHRDYIVWSGPLSSALALRHADDLPSMVWPDDRSWFIGAPIYTCEIALGADEHVIHALLDAPTMQALGARRAERDDILLIDD